MTTFTRRDFMKGAAVHGRRAVPARRCACGCTGDGPGAAAAMGGGGMGVDHHRPARRSLRCDFRRRSPMRRPGTGVYQVSIEARRAAVNVNGIMANLLTYNGQVPGPLIRVRARPALRMKFKNSLPNDGQINVLGDSTRRDQHPYPRVARQSGHQRRTAPTATTCSPWPTPAPATPPTTATASSTSTTSGSTPAGNLNFYHPHIHGSVTDQMWGWHERAADHRGRGQRRSCAV